MTRLAVSENMRRLHLADRRDPVENAAWAIRCLSDDDKRALEYAFNASPPHRMPSVRLNFTFARVPA